MIFAIGSLLVLVAGLLLMVYCSDKAVEHSVFFASILGVSQFMIGFVFTSIGTDLPEIVNSIVSCSLGHADVDAGDSIGSVLAQITLVLGLLAIVTRSFKVKRKEVVVAGACLVASLAALNFVINIGFSRLTALLLIVSWVVYVLITRTVTKKTPTMDSNVVIAPRSWKYHLLIALLGFVGVAVGAYAVVRSVVDLSATLGVPEFLVSFFVVGIGTSLPELVVDLVAIRKRAYEVAIGDIIGSCIVDASLSISIGQFLFPQHISTGLASSLTIYAILASTIVISILAVRGKIEKKTGIIFIIIYFISYLWLFS